MAGDNRRGSGGSTMRPLAALVLLGSLVGSSAACPWWGRGGPPVYCYPPCPPPVVRIVEVRPAEPEKKPAAVTKAMSEEVAPDGWCHLRGRIVYDGDPIPKQKEIPKSGGAYTEDWVVNPTNRGVKNVIVWLAPEPTQED